MAGTGPVFDAEPRISAGGGNLGKDCPAFGRNKTETLFQVECYWRLGDIKNSLRVLDNYHGDLTDPENLYHANILVEIGWRYHRPELALAGFPTLLKQYGDTLLNKDDHNTEDSDEALGILSNMINRVIVLHQYENHAEEAIGLAVQAWETTGEKHFLLTGLTIAETLPQTNYLQELLEKLESQPGEYTAIPLYWLIKARSYFAAGDYQLAEVSPNALLNLIRDQTPPAREFSGRCFWQEKEKPYRPALMRGRQMLWSSVSSGWCTPWPDNTLVRQGMQ